MTVTYASLEARAGDRTPPLFPVGGEPLVHLEIVLESQAGDPQVDDGAKTVPTPIAVPPAGFCVGPPVIPPPVAVALAFALWGPSPPFVEAETVKQ